MSDLVSVVMIFLDEERFIREAVDSVLGQTYEHWELVLVDDGSSDASSAVAREIAGARPERIRYLEHDGHANLGMSASRNLAIRQARGELVAFLDADDVWVPEALSEQVELLHAHPGCAFTAGRAEWWHGWTGTAADRAKDVVQRLDVPLDSVVEPPALLLLFLRDVWASLCGIVVRRQVVEAIGGYEDAFTGMFEDQAFHAKLCLTYPAYVSSRTWYRYRQHPDSCCYRSDREGAWHGEREAFLGWLESYLDARPACPDEVRAALRRELRLYRQPLRHRVERAAVATWARLRNVGQAR